MDLSEHRIGFLVNEESRVPIFGGRIIWKTFRMVKYYIANIFDQGWDQQDYRESAQTRNFWWKHKSEDYECNYYANNNEKFAQYLDSKEFPF
jgi:hypothetical protein